MALCGAIVLQGLAIALTVLVAQGSAESLAAQAAGGTTPSLSQAPISTTLRRHMHVRLSSGRVAATAPRLLPMPRITVRRPVAPPVPR
jgi:hypothetical protein